MPKTRLAAFAIIGAVLLLPACGSGNPPASSRSAVTPSEPVGDDGTTEGEPSAAETPVESAAPKAGLNQPFEFLHTYSDSDETETWQVTLSQVKCGQKTLANAVSNPKWDGGDKYPEYLPAKAGDGEDFCVLYWEWKNAGKTPASTTNAGDLLVGDERFAKTTDDQDIGPIYTKDQLGDAYYNQTDVNPRKTTRSLDVYTVPAGSTPRAVLFPMATVYDDSAMVVSTT